MTWVEHVSHDDRTRWSTTANRSRATPTRLDIQIADSILSEGGPVHTAHRENIYRPYKRSANWQMIVEGQCCVHKRHWENSGERSAGYQI